MKWTLSELLSDMKNYAFSINFEMYYQQFLLMLQALLWFDHYFSRLIIINCCSHVQQYTWVLLFHMIQHTLSDNYIGYIVAISCTLNFTIWRNIARQNVLITDKNSKWGVLLENSGPELSRTFLLLVSSFVGVFVCIELTRHKNWSYRDCQRSLEEKYGCCFQEP